MARHHLIKWQGKHPIQSFAPGLDAAACFQVHERVEAIEVQIPHVNCPIFFEQGHQVTVRMASARPIEFDCLVAETNDVLIDKRLIGERPCGFSLPKVGIDRFKDGLGSLRGNYPNVRPKSRIAMRVIRMPMGVDDDCHRFAGELLG